MNFLKSNRKQKNIRITGIKKSVILGLTLSLLSAFSLNAQPEPPEPPETPKTSKGTSYSITIDNDDDITSNSSVSISVSGDAYKFRGRFHKSKTEGAKAILLNTLGRRNLNINGNTYLWTDSQNGDEVFECKFTSGHIRMSLDAALASDGFLKKINTLGNDLKHYISGTDPKKEAAKKAEKAKRELEKAERALERAQRGLERAENAAKKTKKN